MNIFKQLFSIKKNTEELPYKYSVKEFDITATSSSGKSINIKTDLKSVTTHKGTTEFKREMTFGEVIENVLESNESIVNINIEVSSYYKEVYKDELTDLMKRLGMDDDGTIERTRTYFEEKYMELFRKQLWKNHVQILYPGDHKLYQMFTRFLSEGLSISDSALKCQSIIDREIALLDTATNEKKHYKEKWF